MCSDPSEDNLFAFPFDHRPPNMSSGTVKESLRAEGKNVNWYRSNLESVQEPARRLLETYSGVPPEEVVSHILAVVRLFKSNLLKAIGSHSISSSETVALRSGPTLA